MVDWVVGLVEVDAQGDGDVGSRRALGGCGDDDLAGPGDEVPRGLLALAQSPGRLDDDVDVLVGPGQRPGVALVGDGDVATVHANAVRRDFHRPGEGAVDRVVAQEMREHVAIHQVVDAGPFEVELALVGSAEGSAAGAAEAIDGDAWGHRCHSLVGGV